MSTQEIRKPVVWVVDTAGTTYQCPAEILADPESITRELLSQSCVPAAPENA